MRASVRRCLLVVAFVAGLFVSSPRASLAETPTCTQVDAPATGLQRPPSGGPFRFGRHPESIIRTDVADIHYVRSGPSAVPVRDADKDGVPDYATMVAAAASKALHYYTDPSVEKRSTGQFLSPPCDTAAPSQRPDIYITRLPTYGRAISQSQGAGGAFVLIANNLENKKGIKQYERYGLLWWTVAHETFHLVQYAYVPTGMPRWIAEGTAQTMAFDTGLGDMGSFRRMLLFERRWWAEPSRSFFDPGLYCDRCYGGASFWGLLAISRFGASDNPTDPTLLQALFRRLADPAAPHSTNGTREFVDTYKASWITLWPTVAPENFNAALASALPPEWYSSDEFSIFCDGLYTGTLGRWWGGSDVHFAGDYQPRDLHAPHSATLNPFSCQFIRLEIPSDAKAIQLVWQFGTTPVLVEPRVHLHIGGMRTIDPIGVAKLSFTSDFSNTDHIFDRGFSYIHDFFVPLDDQTRAGEAVLVISSGLLASTSYLLGYDVIR